MATLTVRNFLRFAALLCLLFTSVGSTVQVYADPALVSNVLTADEALRKEMNLRSAVLPFRQWEIKNVPWTPSGQVTTLRASFLKEGGYASPISSLVVILVLEDGRKREFNLGDLSTQDQAYVASLASHDDVGSSDASPTDNYLVHWTDYDPNRDSTIINWHATHHFLFIWGNNIEPSAKDWTNLAFRQMNYDYFEKVWNFNANVTHAPMPYQNDPVKYKTTVYITGTGLPNQAEGFAYGGITIEINPGAMLAGSYVIPHEFTHTLQLHTGGFRGNPLVGWIWETHANWNASQFLPTVPSALDVYNDHLHYELSSSRDNYGSWPFLQFIAEHPRFTPSFNFDIWTQCLRDSDGNATETPLQTICRLGAKTGRFDGDGIAGFGDIVGENAAHYANFDYQDEQAYASLIASSHNYYNDAPRDRAILLPVPDRPNWYHPIYTQTPRQWGFNIIDLKPKPGAVSVSATLQGIVDKSEGSDWREALVVQGADGSCRYSPMLRQGTVSIALQPGDRTLSLAVAGAPDIFKPQPFQAGFNVRAHNVYEVSFMGCTPWSMSDYAMKRPSVAGTSAPNGGGFVAATAHVDSTAFVGPNAMVLGNAHVSGNARIEDYAVVRGNATVSDRAIVCGLATITDDAIVSGDARVENGATVDDNVTVTGNARVAEFLRVHGNGTLQDDVFAKGFGDLLTSADGPIGGATEIGEDSEVHEDTWHQPIKDALLFDFLIGDQFKSIVDNNSVYAHWDCDSDHSSFLKDVVADNDGILRGGASYRSYNGSSILTLDGHGQYALLDGSPADAANWTIDMKIMWLGGSDFQRVFTFGSPTDGAITFTPKGSSGTASFVLHHGTTVETLSGTAPLPIGRWVTVRIAIGNGEGQMFVNGQLVDDNKSFAHSPQDVRPLSGAIGAGLSGRDCFHGEIRDITIYRKTLFTPPTD